jgi:hypothetical protein
VRRQPAGAVQRPHVGTTELAVDYLQPGIDLAAAGPAHVCGPHDARLRAGRCIYNPDLDPGLDGADAIIGYLVQAITGAGPRLPPG